MAYSLLCFLDTKNEATEFKTEVDTISTRMTMLNLIERMAIPTCKDYLTIIEQRAIDVWGEKNWKAEIARKYAELARENGDPDATYETRRRQIYRVFDEGRCNSETLFILAACVECEFQMACKTVYRVG